MASTKTLTQECRRVRMISIFWALNNIILTSVTYNPDSLHPAKLFVNSFDKNGTVEPVRAYQTGDGKLYPY